MTGRTRWLALLASTVVTAFTLSPAFGGKPNASPHGACVSGVAHSGQVGGPNNYRGGAVSQAARGWCWQGPAEVPPAVDPTPTENPPAAVLPTPTPDPTPTPTPDPTPTPTPDPTPSPTPTPTPTPTPFPFPPGGWEQPPQGDWVGVYGADGYALLAWDASTDLVSLPQASLTLDQGARFRWNTTTTSVRALEDPTQTLRRATQWFHSTSLRMHLTFTTAYSGILHLYALDWDGTGRRQTVWVDDGSGLQNVAMSSSFHDGAWLHFPVNVSAGGTVTIRADRVSGQATLSGLFLGEAS